MRMDIYELMEVRERLIESGGLTGIRSYGGWLVGTAQAGNYSAGFFDCPLGTDVLMGVLDLAYNTDLLTHRVRIWKTTAIDAISVGGDHTTTPNTIYAIGGDLDETVASKVKVYEGGVTQNPGQVDGVNGQTIRMYCNANHPGNYRFYIKPGNTLVIAHETVTSGAVQFVHTFHEIYR